MTTSHGQVLLPYQRCSTLSAAKADIRPMVGNA